MSHRRRQTALTTALIPAALWAGLGGQCGTPRDTEPQFSTLSACGLSAVECVPVEGAAPRALAAADFDNDGDLDLLVSNRGTGNVLTLLNDGQAGFTPGTTYAVGDLPATSVAGDWDADGDMDAAVVAGVTTIALLVNQGNAAFAVTQLELDQALNAAPLAVTAADLDQDGDLDLAATAAGVGGQFISGGWVPAYLDHVAVLTNDGRGGFLLAQNVMIDNPSPPQLHAVAAGDFSGDGLPDLAASETSGTVSILTNQGSAGFALTAELQAGSSHDLPDVETADLDGDGDVDLLLADAGDTANAVGGAAVAFFNRGDGTFGSAVRFQAGSTPLSIAIADLDGDGDPDVAAVDESSDTVSILTNPGNAAFTLSRTIAVGDGPSFVLAADLDGDGDIDLAVTNQKANAIGILLNDGTGSFTPGE